MAAVGKAHAAAEDQLEAAHALPTAYLRDTFERKASRKRATTRLDQLATLLPSKSIASDGDAEVDAVTTACLTECGFDPAGVKKARMRSSDVPLCRLVPGEILVARSNTAELVGRASIYRGKPANLVASDLTIRVMAADEVNRDYVAWFLSYLYQTGFWRDHAGGASGSMKKITRTQLAALVLPLPDRQVQDTIATHLATYLEKGRPIQESIQATIASLEALTTALLRRALNGDL